MDWKSYVRYRIRHARMEARLTQVQLAESIGVDNLTVSKFERGKVVPSVETVEKIARATRLPLDWFFRWPSQPANYDLVPVDGRELWTRLHQMSLALADALKHIQQLERLLPDGLLREMDASLSGLRAEAFSTPRAAEN
ncbi:MAG: helix-turn-helix domain-containing protein [Candidatus Eremiobacteraeota bacterium]|nr:helix-turn-helix domain-containing protein [Candidatus Eremiobacteraeota bacterium]MCW5869825.1 helix-turn-helix domain-containing protein [Candidatus Eremiobacteraeota bacterium]